MSRELGGQLESPRHCTFFIETQLQGFKGGIDSACTMPTSKGVVGRILWAKTFCKISPRSTWGGCGEGARSGDDKETGT